MNDGYSHKAALLVVLAVILYVTYILPYKLYSLNVLDRHHFGIFDDLDPQIAVTTAEERAYKERGEPYKTLHDIKLEVSEEARRQKAGERGLWDHHYEKFYMSNVARRMLESLPGRYLEDEDEGAVEDSEPVIVPDPESETEVDDGVVTFNSQFPEAFFTDQ